MMGGRKEGAKRKRRREGGREGETGSEGHLLRGIIRVGNEGRKEEQTDRRRGKKW